MASPFRCGDRVRIIDPNHEYTGSRGTIADPEEHADAGILMLGHHVAIDGENGRTRPFLVSELEPLRAMRARPHNTSQQTGPSRVGEANQNGE
jgi:hypothetical protein